MPKLSLKRTAAQGLNSVLRIMRPHLLVVNLLHLPMMLRETCAAQVQITCVAIGSEERFERLSGSESSEIIGWYQSVSNN